MQRNLTLLDVAAFFVPLIFWAQLMMITHSVIHAWLARGASPTVSLAGFSVALSVNALLGSAFRAFHPIALTFIADRRSVARILAIGGVIAVCNASFMLAVGLTPLGDWVFRGLLGVGPRVAAEAQGASLIFAAVFPLQLTRNVAAGLLMLRRRTMLIALGTLLRLMTLGGWLAGLSFALQGARLGAAALVLCIGVEAGFVLLFARPYYRRLPRGQGAPPAYGEIWRFGWPVIANAMLENALVVVVNAFLARLAHPDLALAGFGVARGLLMVMMNPMRNLAQTAQALVASRREVPVMYRFTGVVSAAFILIILGLFYTPLRGAVLGSVMGLSAELQAAVVPGVLLFAVTPVLWGGAALFRGLLSGAKRTGALAATGGLRVAAAGAVAGGALFWPEANGALVGVLALCVAFAAEVVVLGVSFRGLVRRGVVFPDH